MPPSSRGPSTYRLSLSCLACRPAVAVVLLPNPMPSSRLINACAWRRPSHLWLLLSGVHESRLSSLVALLTRHETWPPPMTLFARSRSDCGIVRPRALAVLRLITNSNLVGCSTGRLPGLVPFGVFDRRETQSD